jgi:alginate O-acetyltransferase complex protein AlgI
MLGRTGTCTCMVREATLRYNSARIRPTKPLVFMVFSSAIFLFLFLPLAITGTFLLRRELRNLFLLIASLFFYAWGETFYVLLMLGSITLNYLVGLALGKLTPAKQPARIMLAIGVVGNLSLLVYFKYANFLVENWNALTTPLGLDALAMGQVHLPLGISFFTFQAISYLVDVYRREAQVESSVINVALYIALFPQLIAGPIVRFHDVAKQLRERTVNLPLAFSGVQRFIYGLAKKMLIANPMGAVADEIFGASGGDLTTPVAWLGLLCYTLQIYFDFSGYSDMAIGLGRMFGFRFLENFNYPYIAASMQDFWRRWHISLSSWFRDYLYIPLGGNRAGPVRTYFNLLLVFVLCGFWHGASWNFLIWGLLHGFFLILERAGLARQLTRLPRFLGHAYTLLVVMFAWVFFRAETLPQSLEFLSALGGLNAGNPDLYYLQRYLDAKVILVLICGLVLATPISKWLQAQILDRLQSSQGPLALAAGTGFLLSNLILLGSLFLLCLLVLASTAYNPFIYFRF